MGTETSSKKRIINNRYEIVRTLGGGAQGEVYEVIDILGRNRRLALKTLISGAPGALLRFEFEQLSKLDHPHLVKVFDLGLVTEVSGEEGPLQGAAFFTQELVTGQPAHKWVREIDPEERFEKIAGVGVAVARALALLHGCGLLHRDVKPSNILVGPKGDPVKLIDLGLSRPLDGPDGLRAGTLGYMAPESLRGFPDERSDLYGLGTTLAELLSGRYPRPGKPLAARAPRGVPSKLWKLVARLTSDRPGSRLQSAKETVLALGRAVGAGILGEDRDAELLDASSESETEGTRVAKVRSAELVGRDTQRSRIGDWIMDALGGDAQTVQSTVVVGPPGVGKTRLLRTAVVDMQLRAVEGRDAPPTLLAGSLKDLMISIARNEDREERPHLGRWLHAESPIEDSGWPEARGDALLKEMAAAVREIGFPAVLLIEDGDTALATGLLTWLDEVVPGPGSAPLVVVVEMHNHNSARKVAEQSGAELVEVSPLDRSAETEMVAGVIGRRPADAFMAKLGGLTGGVPLLTEAVLAAVMSNRTDGRVERENLDKLELKDDPGKLVLAGLLAGLSGAAKMLAESLAAVGVPAEIDEAMFVAGVDDAAVALDAVRHLERMGWLTRDSLGQLSLPGFVARCLDNALSKSRARTLHGRVLYVLKKRPAADPGRLAVHAARTGKKEEACALARRAIDGLKSAGDLNGAAQQLELLLTLEGEGKLDAVETELARVCRQTGRYDRALDLATAVEQRNGDLAPQAALEKAAALRLSGKIDDALTVLADLKASSDEVVALEARAIAARIELDRGDLDAAARRIGEVSSEPDPRLVRSGTLSTAGLIALQMGEHARAESLFAAGLEAAKQAGSFRDRARFHGLAGMVHHARDDWEAAMKSYRAALDLADAAGDRHGAATYAVNLAAAYTELDQVRGALDCYRDGLGRLRRIGRAPELAQAGANYGQLLLRVGDVEGADAAVSQAMKDAKKAATDRVSALVKCVRGDVLLSLGKSGEARGVLVEAEKLARKVGAGLELTACRQHLAAAELAEGNTGEASRWLEETENTGDASVQAKLEQDRLRLEIALAGEGDKEEALDLLWKRLHGGNAPRRIDQLRAFATAARAADKVGRVKDSHNAARTALGLLTSLHQITPSLHREPDTQLAKEMAAICGANPEGDWDAPLSSRVSSEGWERLFRINARLNSEQRVGRLLELIMDTAIEITGAERGFLLIVNHKGELKVRCARNIDQESLTPGEQSFSGSVAVRAFELGEPVLTTDAQEDERFQSMLSVVNLNLRYVAAVPLQVKGKTTGTIYLDSRNSGRFDEGRLRLLCALADQAAIALTNARLTQENRRRQRRIERLNSRLASRLESREGELEQVQDELDRRTDELVPRSKYEGIVARSRVMGDVFKLLDRVVDSDLPVVIEGESGTGKELIARALHFNGPRKRRPFVAENCAAIPETLLESVLFGHTRGAFTGAIRDSRGLFVGADGGTLFLDEVSAMPPAMQVKLLRVLQDGVVRPVGGNKTVRVDVRIAVASNTDLGAMVKAGTFREDLFYRLNVMCLRLPPLRNRTEDIPLLIEHFARKHGGEHPPRISKEALEALMDYPWPGNVRQLENEVMRAIVLCDETVEIDHLSEEIVSGVSQMSESIMDLNMNNQVERLKRRLISLALKRTGGNQTAAATILGLSRYGLQKMIARLKIGGDS
ncbi:MAG: GAF domain-containing protein [Deltaproteobacteria bacterium]|nr:GAF domain-containing protein [Deltaproteobacteria bacterium]